MCYACVMPIGITLIYNNGWPIRITFFQKIKVVGNQLRTSINQFGPFGLCIICLEEYNLPYLLNII